MLDVPFIIIHVTSFENGTNIVFKKTLGRNKLKFEVSKHFLFQYLDSIVDTFKSLMS